MKSEQIKEITDKATERLVAALKAGRSEALTGYLKAIGRFHRYSLYNVMLIASQKPNASYVAGFRTVEPAGPFREERRKGHRDSRSHRSPEDGERRGSGRGCGFHRRFSGCPLIRCQPDRWPELPQIGMVQGEPREYLERLRSFASSQGISVEHSLDIAPARGASSGGRITLLPGQSEAEEFSTLAHELAHELLHRGDRRSTTSRRIRETEAEVTAFVVCHAIELETGSAASDHIQLWKGDAQLLTESLGHVRQAASQMLTALTDA
jgi:hypothetical protein